MAGDITKRIVSQIRDRLALLSNNTVLKNDFLIYNLMNKYQSKWMLRYRTNRHYYTINLTNGVKSYPLDKRVYEVISVKNGINNVIKEYEGYYDDKTNSIILNYPETIAEGDKLICCAYIKPYMGSINVYTPDDDSGGTPVICPTGDKILSTTDPIIPPEYYDYLEEAVLTDLRPKLFRPIQEIEYDVSATANRLRGTFYATNKTNNYNQFN